MGATDAKCGALGIGPAHIETTGLKIVVRAPDVIAGIEDDLEA